MAQSESGGNTVDSMNAGDSPTAPVILLAPGAGAGSSSSWMQAWRSRLAAAAAVETFDYPYRLAGRKAPDKLPVLVAAHRQALADARRDHPLAAAGGVVVAGKSMGGRIGCHVALADPVDAIVCFGYPLRGTSGALRDEVLLALRTPVLFIQGTRDPLCPLDLLAGVRERMSAPSQLLVVEGGNHSLEVPRKRKPRAVDRTSAGSPAGAADPQAASDDEVLRTIQAFLEKFLRPGAHKTL